MIKKIITNEEEMKECALLATEIDIIKEMLQEKTQYILQSSLQVKSLLLQHKNKFARL